MNPENDAVAAGPSGPVDLDALKELTGLIVADGEDVRGKISGLVAEAARRAQETGQGMIGLVRAVVEGAVGGATRAMHDHPEGALKQVTEALGDGLSQAALSAKLAMEEAQGRGRKFNEEDLKRVGDNFESLRTLFAQTVSDGSKSLRAQVSDQVGDLTTHAESVLARMRPTVEAAVKAARDNPVELGKESLAAGGAAAREATGALFAAMGQALQRAGESLKKERDDAAEG